LVNKKQATKAKKSSKKSRNLRKEIQAATEEKKAEQLAKDKVANEKIKLEAQKKAIVAQVKQLISMNALALTDDSVEYKFTDDNKVKTLRISELQQTQLVKGILAIAKYEEGYKLIPSVVADKIAERDESAIVLSNENTSTEVDEDDPYADFQVPDDLMW
jgi:uncharacterized protein YaiL (DUF2058 family)